MLRLPPPLSSLLRRLSSLTRAFSSATDAREAYRRKMLGRPPTVKLRELDWKKNSCSFIGTVLQPVKQHSPGTTYTILEVNPSGKYFSYPSRIGLHMRDKIAEVSLQYLKPNDFVYVLGVLKSYKTVDENGDTQVHYKVFVTALNYVTRRASDPRALDQERATSSSEPDNEMDRLHLWGGCTSQTQGSGGITGSGRSIQGLQILDTRTRGSVSGSCQTTHRGFKNSFGRMTQIW